MKKIKPIIALVLAALLLFSFVACNSGSNDETTTAETTLATAPSENSDETNGTKINVAAISGPTGMGMVKLMDNSNYNFKLVTDPTEVVALISTGAVDIAACPLNLAANLYKKTNGNIKMLGINTLGVLYVVTNGVTVNSIKDLKDKTIYSTGQGATPEFILNYILAENGIKDDVKIEYLSEHSELAAKLASGEAQIGVLPEPFVSLAASKNDKLNIALSLTSEWENVASETELAMGCVIARSDFVEKNPDAVNQFINNYKASVEYVNRNTLEASEKIVEKKIVDSAIFAVDENQSANKVKAAKKEKAADVITRCNIVFIDGETMQSIADANFNVYFNADPKSVGGSVPASEIYYAAK
ncbi:MAG: PhnD/SsuA/transferrin family substrate-binding protein [Faecalibacterium sp.]|nr:PhnD/SsuA/transferrin family substrate-binding protein [Ruminococcus sp.]MCM1392022.1 PhnD/SsuA/transferrin family substrate-binding protein [Ruminococcus sp.]MCM1484829.1 PhnD/SsuA/transferrin family substrate-binding protein [Faecalibacterium sp.]